MRDYKVMIRLNQEEKDLFEETAGSQGLPTASWGRLELLRSARESAASRVAERALRARPRRPLLSLFCGPGGLDEGFRRAGFTTVLAIDNDEECVNTFSENHREAVVKQADISKLSVADLNELLGYEVDPIGVLGGPPCQSFSVSNVYQREDDPRHRLPEAYGDLLRELNTRNPISFFVFENVPGLLGKKHRHRYEDFKDRFSKAGFRVFEKLLDARDYGVPQVRPRIFVVGINRDLFPRASWSPPEPKRNTPTVRDTIGGLPEPVFNGRGLDPKTFPEHENHWCLVPRSKKFSNGKLEQGQMHGRSFRTLSWDEPSWTVAYGHREVHVHPEGHRRLSIFEAMLLQTFPREYRLTGNMSAQVRLVSEAVPPLLAQQIAESIRNSLGI